MTKTELVEPRDLTPNERNLLLFLLGHISFDGAQELAGQVERTKVAGGIPTLLQLDVPRTVPASAYKDRRIPQRAFVYAQSGELEGEVIVWVRDGYLSRLEYAWYTREPPSEMPAPDRIRVE